MEKIFILQLLAKILCREMGSKSISIYTYIYLQTEYVTN